MEEEMEFVLDLIINLITLLNFIGISWILKSDKTKRKKSSGGECLDIK